MPAKKTVRKSVVRKATKKSAVRKSAVKKTKTPTTKVILVGVMGRATENIAITKETVAQDIATKMGIEFARVEASKDATGENFIEIKGEDIVNGYKSIVFTPEVSGGKV